MTTDRPESTGRRVSMAVINFNGEATLLPTLESVFRQEGGLVDEVMLIDNHSSDASVRLVRERFGDAVRVVSLPENRGPNPARNAALKTARNELVQMMDNDIILDSYYVRRLAAAFDLHPDAGAASGQIRLHDQPDVIQYNGAFIHYAGEVVANRTDADVPVRVGVVPTGALMVSKPKAAAVGFLDEDMIFGWADGDFTHRLSLSGADCYVDSRAVCYHMKRDRGMKWVRYQVRNRWWFILKYYDLRTLLLALPGILFYQGCAGIFFILKGQGLAFFRGSLDALLTLPAVWRKRRAIFRYKRRPDSALLSGGAIELPGQVRRNSLAGRLGRAASVILSAYWHVIRWALR